jgi:hypothetical protein
MMDQLLWYPKLEIIETTYIGCNVFLIWLYREKLSCKR